MTEDMVREWAQLYAHEIGQPSATVQSASEMTRDIDQRIAALQLQADCLYRRWLRPLI